MELIPLAAILVVVCALSFWLGMGLDRLIKLRACQKEYDAMDGDSLDLFVKEMILLEAYLQLDPERYGDMRETHIVTVRSRAVKVAKELLSQPAHLRVITMKRLKRMGYSVQITGSFVGPAPLEFTISNDTVSVEGVVAARGC